MNYSTVTFDEAFDDILQGNKVNLASFNLHDKLNGDFWDSNLHLNEEIRVSLIKIGLDFYESMKLSELGIGDNFLKDMYFVGSLASFNYSKYADIDLHLIVDIGFLKLNTPTRTLLEKYFTQSKAEWNTQHSDLTIKGYDVEVYVQDKDEQNAANGVYSLFTDKWVKTPDKMEQSFNVEYVKRKAEKYISQIDYLEEYLMNLKKGDEKAKKVEEICELLKDKIVSGRKESLNTGDRNEMADGNIVFKVLRRTGHLGKLWDLMDLAYDKGHSLYESRRRSTFQTSVSSRC